MTTAAPLEVVLTLPPAPLTLATSGFLQTLATVEQDIAALTVSTPEQAQQAANIQSRLTTAGATLEKQRKALKQPFIDAGKAIDNAAAEPAARIEAAKGTVKRLLTNYDNEVRRKAEEAERARQAELRRLEEIARVEREAAEREAKRIADELAEKTEAAQAAMPDVEIMEMDDDTPPPPVQKTETEKAIEAIQHAPVVAAPRPVGITYRTTLVATVVDVNKLPDVFVERTPKLAAIKSTFCSGWSEGKPMPVCAGVEFKVERTPVSTGR